MHAVRQELAGCDPGSSVAGDRGRAAAGHDGAELPGVRNSGNSFLLPSDGHSSHCLRRSGERQVAGRRFGRSASRVEQREDVVLDLPGTWARDICVVCGPNHGRNSQRHSSPLGRKTLRYKKMSKNRLLALMLVAFAGAVVMLQVFDPATSGIFPPCPVRYWTGWYCPGCGSLRAIHQLLHGNLRAAWALNPLTMVLLPFLTYGLASFALFEIRGKGLPQPFLPAV